MKSRGLNKFEFSHWKKLFRRWIFTSGYKDSFCKFQLNTVSNSGVLGKLKSCISWAQMLSGLEVVGRTRSKKSNNSHCYLQYYLLIATDCDFTSLAIRSKKILSYYNVFTQCSNVNCYHRWFIGILLNKWLRNYKIVVNIDSITSRDLNHIPHDSHYDFLNTTLKKGYS